MLRRLTFATATAALILSPIAASAQTARAITQSDRTQGAQANPQLVAQFGGRYDGPQAAFVERVGRRVALQSGLSNSQNDFTVQLLNSPVENAFAIPGGYVYVTRQLLALMDSEDELAFVLGHEVGHVAARHSAGRQQTSAISGVLAGIVGAVAGNSTFGQLLGTGAQQAAGLFTLRYGRNQEYEADALGIRYVAGAAYDPYAAPIILTSLDAQTSLSARAAGRQANAMPSWLSTHPSSVERVRRARQLAQQTGRAGTRAGQDTAFLRMLDGMVYDDDPAQGVIDGQTFRHPQMRFRFTAPAGYSIANATDAVTVAGQRGQAQLAAAGGTTPANAVVQRFQAIGGRIDPSQVRQTTIAGRPASVASTVAASGNQRVDATVIGMTLPSGTYTWTIVTPQGSGIGPFEPLIASFAPLDGTEAAQIRGKRIRIHTVRAGDTIDSLSRQMAYPSLQRERFLTLNGLSQGDALTPGTLVKLVVTG